jgi:3-phosphoshikimate 1-carboxyvinyltransferase
MTEPLKSGCFTGGVIEVPGSKSLTQRALLIAALAEGESVISRPLDSDDRRYLEAALAALGVAIHSTKDEIRVTGGGGKFQPVKEALYVGNAGTAMRFLTPALLLGAGGTVIDGNERMRKRPIGDLVEALSRAGAEIEYLREPGYPPLKVHGGGIEGGRLKLRGDSSSQFLSGLLIAGAYARKPLEVLIEGELVSRPYVAMTAALMKHFGVDCGRMGDELFAPGRGPYRGTNYTVEPDASSASYWLALAAIHDVETVVSGLHPGSLQGDCLFSEDLARMGALVHYRPLGQYIDGAPVLLGSTFDLGDRPDVAPTLAVVALFAGSPSRIENIAHLRLKESDRIAVLAAGLRALGAEVVEEPDALEIRPATAYHGANLNVHDDHRMAMAFAVAATKIPGVSIDDKACVAKSYPDFFAELDSRLD